MRIVLEEPLHGGGQGGVSVYARNLIRELGRLDPGNEYFLFSFFRGDYARRVARMQPPPGARYQLMVPRWSEAAVRLAEWRLGLPLIESYLLARGVGLLHAHRVPARHWLKTVVTVHDLFPVVHPEWTSRFLTDMWERELKPGMARVDKIIAVSEHTKKDLIERWSVPAEKIVVTHEGVDRSVFRPLPRAEARAALARLDLPERFVLMIGPFDPWCDPQNAVRAVSRLPGALADVGIVFAGQPGGCADAAKRRAEELGLAGKTRWTGYLPQEELVALYSLADVLVYPSFYEGFGLPVLEAMACGTPVLTSDSSSLPEVAGDAAILVHPTNEDALADALRRILDDASLRASLREKGLQRAAAFSWEATARATLAVYKGLQ